MLWCDAFSTYYIYIYSIYDQRIQRKQNAQYRKRRAMTVKVTLTSARCDCLYYINILYVGLHVVVKQVFVVSLLSVNIVPMRKATGSSKILVVLFVIIVIIKLLT